MHAVAEPALEAVSVEQREEELEVFLLAVVRRRRHEQEVAREAGDELAELIALGVFDFTIEERSGEFVCFVAHHEIVVVIGSGELLPHVLVARELVKTCDGEVVFEEPVAGAGGLQLVVRHDLERQVEPAAQLVLPLLGKAPGADDEAALQVAARDQLLDEEAGHDRLAGAGVVGEQEAQRLARQHRLVDRRDLVRQRIDQRGVHREHGIKQVREANALRFGHEPEHRAVAVEAPRTALFHRLEASFVVTEEHLFGHAPGRIAVRERQRVGAMPLHADDVDDGAGEDTADGRAGDQLFELHGRSVCALAPMFA